MMDRYLVRYFLAVVDQGNFSRAAAQCHVSQPTLSVGIAKLERSLGLSLFQRSNQRVQLTEGGNRFLPHARRIEREFTAALQAMTGVSPRPMLRLGLLQSVPGSIVADAVEQCGAGDTQLEFMQGSERELAQLLERGRLDVALTLVRGADARLMEQAVWEEPYMLALPPRHRFAAVDEVEAGDLRDETMIVRRHCEILSETSRFFVERGVRPHFAMRSTNDERVMQMIRAGLGITVMPASYRTVELGFTVLAGFTARRTVGFQFGRGAEGMREDPHPLMAAIMRRFATDD